MSSSPYVVAESPELGRHWVAARDIAAGEVLLEERPLVVGPKAGSPPVCLACYAPAADYRCSACGWPVCGPRCEAAAAHRDAECRLIGGHYDGRRSAAYCFVAPLRCMLLAGRGAAEFRSLQSHLDDRLDTPLYRAYAVNVAAFVLDRLGLRSADGDDRSALEAAAVLDTNAFDVRRPGGRNFRAVYARASMMAHCCTPNTKHVFVGDAADGRPAIRVLATVPIGRGHGVTATYTQTLWCTRDRRRHLSAAKCFECACARCADPEELGTHLGSAACGGPCSGRVAAAAAGCATCGRPADDPEAEQRAVRAVGVLSKSRDCAGFERFLERVRDGTMPPLHDNHHVAVGVKYALVQLYGDRISDLTVKQLENNSAICEQLLRLADVLEPGITRFRGLLLYYLVCGLKQLKRKKHRRNYDEMIKNFAREAVVILKTEPDLMYLVEQLQ
ncbi:unnamed protein product [Aphis gossypii]|uniref:Protein msta n=1 Tax=Aphis gossypii TaxID=80765 RepID=A0A9P0JD26_APHGO|nr:unnamed protein product [Aphis gossypii]